MIDVNKTLNQIERLLMLAERDLENDDGRHWPPPPAPPKNRCHWATDNSGNADPHDYESCKQYALTKLPMRPQIQPGTFPELRVHPIVLKLEGCRNKWVEYIRFGSPRPIEVTMGWLQGYLDECRTVYGMIIDVKAEDRSIQLRWSDDDSPPPDTRDITHAQRMAEQRLLYCRKPLRAVIDEARTRALFEWEFRCRIKGYEKAYNLERYFADNVVQWLPRIIACTTWFNRLSRDIYKSGKHLLPVPDRRLTFKPSYRLHYPWWPRSRYLRWQTVIDLVVGGFPDDWRLPPSWNISRSRLRAEVDRWVRFRAAESSQPG